MPGNYATAGPALRESQSGPEESGDSENEAPAQREDTFFLPQDYPGADDLQPGDTLSLRVVGKTEDGRCEVECVHDKDDEQEQSQDSGNGKSVMQDMEESLS